jgi:hypothetical protein
MEELRSVFSWRQQHHLAVLCFLAGGFLTFLTVVAVKIW